MIGMIWLFYKNYNYKYVHEHMSNRDILQTHPYRHLDVHVHLSISDQIRALQVK